MPDNTDMVYVRGEMAKAEPAPAGQRGLAHWARTNLFATPVDTILTVIALLVLAWFLPSLLRWLFIDAVWNGADRTVLLTIACG